MNFGSDPEYILDNTDIVNLPKLRLLGFARYGATVQSLWLYLTEVDIYNLFHLHARTCCSLVTTLCRFQSGVAAYALC